MVTFLKKIFGIKSEFGRWMESEFACRAAINKHSHQTAQEAWDSCENVEWMLWAARKKFLCGEPGWLTTSDFKKIKELLINYNRFDNFGGSVVLGVYEAALYRCSGTEINKLLTNEIRKIVPKVGV